MASTINADNGVSSGSAGVKTTADSSGVLALQTNGTTAVTVDTSQNVGLGVTPSAWYTSSKALQILGASIEGRNTVTQYYCNGYLNADASQEIYLNNGYATKYRQSDGAHQWNTAASGTAGNAITFTAAMTLDASGNLGVGTTSPGAKLDVSSAGIVSARINNTASSSDAYLICKNTSGESFFGVNATGPYIYTATAQAMTFHTNNTERARITSGGDLIVGATASTNPGITIYGSTKGIIWQNNDAQGNGFVFTSYRRSNTEIGSVSQNGTTAVLYNINSDRRLKDNIVPAPNAGEKIDAIEIVSYDWKSAPDEHVEFGVVAQDLYAIVPQAVNVGNDGEEIEKTWGVDYSKLVPMLVKEIQSLRVRSAALEAEVAALKAR